MITVIELVAVICGAVFGVLLARRKNLDFVGVFSVALMTSFGGGTVRDVLLDRHPLFWISHPHYPLLVFIVAAVASVIPRIPVSTERWLLIPDAIGLALFSVVGVDYALQEDVAPFPAVLFGVMTGTFGGVMGDIVCNEVPSLFRPSTPLYATCAFLGGWVFVLGRHYEFPADAVLWASSTTIMVLRLLAIRFHICLRAIGTP